MDQLTDNINTMSSFKPVNENEKTIIATVVEELRKIKPIPCTACKYCMPCPAGVNIPGIFTIYNNFKKTNNVTMAKSSYFENMQESSRANNCIKCGAWLPECPQHIDIPTELERIHNELNNI